MPDPEMTAEDSPGGAAIAVLFAASGAAALIYEIVWFQLLQLVIGSSAVSVAVLLTTFMGGICAGSLLVPRVASQARHPLKMFAAVEASIAGLAAIVLLGAPRITIAHASLGSGAASLALRAVVAAICLLPPTVLMGSTLPIVSRWARVTSHGLTSVGLFYSANIAGAMAGCLVAAFFLLRLYDVTVATAAAAGLNLLVAATAVLLARRGGMPQPRDLRPVRLGGTRRAAQTIHVVVALSGLAALGAEVVWTRILSLVIGATVYTFAMILAVFLLGLGVGSGVGALLARLVADPRLALGMCQWMLVGACAWAAWMLASVLPYWPVDPALAQSPWLALQIDLTRCAWAILPATLLWGASFPLALASVAGGSDDPAQIVGRLYAANTVGAIAGALLATFVAIPTWGMQGAERALLIVSALAGTLALSPAVRARAARGRRRAPLASPMAAWLAASGILVVLVVKLPAVPGLLIAYGRYLVTVADPVSVVYTGDGVHSSIAVTRLPDGVRNFHVSGKIEASSQRDDMRLQRMLGHLPALIHPAPASVLVVGFGAGVTAGSFVVHPEVRRIVVAEIEPLIPRGIGPYFTRENHDVLHDRRLELVYDDARQYLASTNERFDVITSDPIHPWVKGSAALYTREYFEMLARRLRPGGLVTQWLPLYESDLEVVRSQMATFFAVFPDATVWANLQNERGYDLVLLGGAGTAPLDVSAIDERFRDGEHARAAASLREVGLDPIELLSTYAGRAADLAPWLEGAPINRDRNMRLQYLAGLQANRYESDAIYTQIVERRVFPEGLFRGSADEIAALRQRLGVRPQ